MGNQKVGGIIEFLMPLILCISISTSSLVHSVWFSFFSHRLICFVLIDFLIDTGDKSKNISELVRREIFFIFERIFF